MSLSRERRKGEVDEELEGRETYERDKYRTQKRRRIRTGIKELVKDPPPLLQPIGGRHVLVLGGVLLRFNQ